MYGPGIHHVYVTSKESSAIHGVAIPVAKAAALRGNLTTVIVKTIHTRLFTENHSDRCTNTQQTQSFTISSAVQVEYSKLVRPRYDGKGAERQAPPAAKRHLQTPFLA